MGVDEQFDPDNYRDSSINKHQQAKPHAWLFPLAIAHLFEKMPHCPLQ